MSPKPVPLRRIRYGLAPLYLVLAAVCVIIFPMLAVSRSGGPNRSELLVSVPFGVALGGLWATFASSRVDVFDWGLGVRNPFSRARLSWAEIRSFSRTTTLGWFAVPAAETDQGAVPLFALQDVSQVSRWADPQHNWRLDVVVEEWKGRTAAPTT